MVFQLQLSATMVLLLLIDCFSAFSTATDGVSVVVVVAVVVAAGVVVAAVAATVVAAGVVVVVVYLAG